METEVLERIQSMKLTTDEDEVMAIRPVRRDKILEEFSLSLIGRFLTSKSINFRAAKNLIRSMWKLGDDLRIVELGDGIFQFKFSLESQMAWVWNNSPWCFDNHLLALRRWEKGITVRTVTFTHQPFWIQVWGLPFDLITEEAGRDIGSGIGKLVEVDCKAFQTEQSRFLRIRVEVPLDKPLRRGGPVISPEQDEVRVAFKYERLVGWCFTYGKIGHDHKECPSSDAAGDGEKLYGEWLKAGVRVRHDGMPGRQPPSQWEQSYAPTRNKNRESVPPTVEPAKTVEPDTAVNAQSDMIQETEMANPRFTEQQIRSKKSIHSLFYAPQLDTTNEPVTKTCHSQPHLCEADRNNVLVTNKAHSTPNLCETENHGEELFSVPISYGTTETQTKTLVTHPREPK